MTKKSDISRSLTEAPARLLAFARKVGSATNAELLRRIAAVSADSSLSSKLESEHTDAYLVTPMGMRDALEVALVLLDEIFELVPGESGKRPRETSRIYFKRFHTLRHWERVRQEGQSQPKPMPLPKSGDPISSQRSGGRRFSATNRMLAGCAYGA